MREHSGTSIAIGGISTFAFTLWGGVLAVMLWGGITVYAIVKWIGSPQEHPSATTLLGMMGGLVSVYPGLLALGLYLITKPMRYARKSAKKDGEQLTLPPSQDNRA